MAWIGDDIEVTFEDTRREGSMLVVSTAKGYRLTTWVSREDLHDLIHVVERELRVMGEEA